MTEDGSAGTSTSGKEGDLRHPFCYRGSCLSCVTDTRLSARSLSEFSFHQALYFAAGAGLVLWGRHAARMVVGQLRRPTRNWFMYMITLKVCDE